MQGASKGEDRGASPVEAQIAAASARAMQACFEISRALVSAGVAPEALAEFVPAGKRLLVLPRAATMRPIGEVWRLGALLLGTDGSLWAAGGATRAAERGRAGYQSISREERRDLAAAALRGGYEIGAPVNFDAAPLLLDEIDLRALGRDCPIGWADDEVRVRWRPGAPLEGASTLEGFLRERAALLIDPPLGSG